MKGSLRSCWLVGSFKEFMRRGLWTRALSLFVVVVVWVRSRRNPGLMFRAGGSLVGVEAISVTQCVGVTTQRVQEFKVSSMILISNSFV